MEPKLVSILLTEIQEAKSIVKIVYRIPKELDGIELMGVDAGLSWLKNESIKADISDTNDEFDEYTILLELEDSCEFRARGYDTEKDYWEPIESNHKLLRNDKGNITFETQLHPMKYTFWGYLPTDYSPTLEDAYNRLVSVESEEPSIYQILVDLSIWVPTIFEKELEEASVYPLSAIMRALKKQSRELQSFKVDEVTQPVLTTLFQMYLSSMEHHGEELKNLTAQWKEKGYLDTFSDLPSKVKELESSKLGVREDGLEKFKILLKYVS